MYDEAYKKQPGDEELGAQTFMANAKIGNWKVAQQVNVTCFSVILFCNVIFSEFSSRSCTFTRSLLGCIKISRTTDSSTGASCLPFSKCVGWHRGRGLIEPDFCYRQMTHARLPRHVPCYSRCRCGSLRPQSRRPSVPRIVSIYTSPSCLRWADCVGTDQYSSVSGD